MIMNSYYEQKPKICIYNDFKIKYHMRLYINFVSINYNDKNRSKSYKKLLIKNNIF